MYDNENKLPRCKEPANPWPHERPEPKIPGDPEPVVVAPEPPPVKAKEPPKPAPAIVSKPQRDRKPRSGKGVIGTNIETGKEARYESMTAAAADGFDPSTIGKCIRGKRTEHKGWTWKEAKES